VRNKRINHIILLGISSPPPEYRTTRAKNTNRKTQTDNQAQ